MLLYAAQLRGLSSDLGWSGWARREAADFDHMYKPPHNAKLYVIWEKTIGVFDRK